MPDEAHPATAVLADEGAAAPGPFRVFWGKCRANVAILLPISAAYLIAVMMVNGFSIPTACHADAPAVAANGKRYFADWVMCSATEYKGVKDKIQADFFQFPQQPPRQDVVVKKPNDPPVDLAKQDALAQAAGLVRHMRQSSAHMTWAAAFGLLVIVGLIANVAALWEIAVAVVKYRRYMTGVQSPSQSVRDEGRGAGWWFRTIARYTAFLFVGGVGLYVVFGIIALAVNLVMGIDVWVHRQPVYDFLRIGSGASPFFDALMAWLTAAEPDVDLFLRNGSYLCAAGLVLLAILVGASLYQSAGDIAFRASTVEDKPRDDRYIHYLQVSFERLKFGVYLGAILLAAMITELAAQYSWATSFIDPVGDYASAATALSGFGQQMATEIGFGFTLLLVALYFPAIMILRMRGREFYRSRYPLKTLAEQEQFLTDQGLTVKVSAAYSDFLVLLAPLGTGAATHLFTVLGS